MSNKETVSNPKISVAVPVYKVEKFLPACIESILSQSFTDFELILIDDGSPDNSGEICEKYAEKDSRIRVIHKENAGLSHTRNVGIETARGAYIYFLDSDDCMLPDTLQTLYDTAVEYGSDIVMGGYRAVVERDGVETASFDYTSPTVHVNGKQEIARHVLDWKNKVLIDLTCNKLYRLDLLRESGVRMPVGELFEDTEFNLRFLPHVQSFTNIERCLFNYMQRTSGSITKSYNPDKIVFLKKRHIALKEYFDTVGAVTEEIEQQISFFYIKYIFSCFIDLFFKEAYLSGKQRRAFMKQEMSEDEFVRSAKKAAGQGRYDKMIARVARSQNTMLVYLFSRCMYILKFKLQSLFFVLKQKNKKQSESKV